MKKIIWIVSIGLLISIFSIYSVAYASEIAIKDDITSLEFIDTDKDIEVYIGDEFYVWYEFMRGNEYLNDTELDLKTKITSSDKSIVEVRDKYTLIAKKEGKVIIKVKNGKLYDTKTIIVKKNGVISEFNSIVIDMPHILTVKGPSLNNSKTKVTSSNIKMAEVVNYGDGNYLIVGKKVGTVTITVESGKEIKTVKYKVVPTPSLKLVSYKAVWNQDKVIVGYELKLKNTGKNPITITAGRDGDTYGFSDNELKKSIIIQPKKTKVITVPNEKYAQYIFDSEGKLYEDRVFGVNVSYEGNNISFWFNQDKELENRFIKRLVDIVN